MNHYQKTLFNCLTKQCTDLNILTSIKLFKTISAECPKAYLPVAHAISKLQ